MFIEMVDGRNNFKGIVTEIAENLSDARPVFLFNMGVIVFFIRA